MSGEEIFGLIVILGVCFGCGAMILGIGIWAERSKKPFGFWTFREVIPESISDIPSYNRENGKMWKAYSVPYFLAGFCGICGIWLPWCHQIAGVLVILACTLGILCLIWCYKRISRKYFV